MVHSEPLAEAFSSDLSLCCCHGYHWYDTTEVLHKFGAGSVCNTEEIVIRGGSSRAWGGAGGGGELCGMGNRLAGRDQRETDMSCCER